MSGPRVQHKAPNFHQPALDAQKNFVELKLADFAGKYLVVFFYPADFTFVCPTEIIAFSDRADEFRKLGCEVVGVSCDSKVCPEGQNLSHLVFEGLALLWSCSLRFSDLFLVLWLFFFFFSPSSLCIWPG
jgi:hypothetical protein